VQCCVVIRSQIYLIDLASKGVIHEELGLVVKYPGDRHVRVLVDAAGLFEEPLHIRQTIEASRIARDYLAGEMLLRVLLRARGREGNQHEKRSEHRTSSGEFLLGGRRLRAGIISRNVHVRICDGFALLFSKPFVKRPPRTVSAAPVSFYR
jgi:hypothetical protein